MNNNQKLKSVPNDLNTNQNSSSLTNSPEITVEEKIRGQKSQSMKRLYSKGRFLGKGGFAKCYELICKDNNKVFAAKMIQKSNIKTPRQKQKLRSEIKIHKSCHHSHVVAFEHDFEDSEYVYILLELCENQTLNEIHHRRKTLTELEVQCYMIQLIKALKYLHSHRIIHRDLKLGNLFLNDKMELKVGDFGLATKLDYDGERKKTICGTPNYIAPEVISSLGHSFEVDIWAIGIIIYTLLIGKPPFETRDVKITYDKIKKAEFYFPQNSKISNSAKNLIKKILVVDPNQRPSLNEILFDEFFNQGITIPKLLPTATLAFKPTSEYINKYMHQTNDTKEENINKETSIEISKNNFCEENTMDTEGSTKSIPPFINTTILSKKEVYVTKWIDYTDKYGLGYMLNNRLIGVYFNDNTKMLFNPNHRKITYIERKISDNQDLLSVFSLDDYPIEMKNKILLFEQFKNFLKDEDIKNKHNNSLNKSREKKNASSKSLKRNYTTTNKKINEPKLFHNNLDLKNNMEEIDYIYVKKWLKTKHALIFRFSNKIVQTCFHDRSQIIIHPLNKNIIYINKSNEKATFDMNDSIIKSNYEISKRIKYVKDVLMHMITINKQKSDNANNPEKKMK